MRNTWRDSQEWSSSGLNLSTPSNEACKLYDASLTQYVGWYDDQTLGGLETCITKMIAADPEFVLGRALAYGLEVIGSGTSIQREDSNIVVKIRELDALKKKQGSCLTKREQDHVEALSFWANGNFEKAAQVWEDILIRHPKDMHAIKMVQDTYFYMGSQIPMRDCIARVMPEWKEHEPLQSYLYGMYAFGLVETNLFEEAEQNGVLGLERNRKDGWATHALAHVYEMTGQYDRGIRMLESTVQDWESCNYLACHNNWHWAIYHVEKNEPEAALEIYEKKICPAATGSLAPAMLDYVDAASLLYRLQLEDVNVGDRWSPLSKVAATHRDDHVLIFNDAHFLMSFLGNKEDELAQEFFTSCKNLFKNGTGDEQLLTKDVGEGLLEAIVAYDKQDYTLAANLLNSIKYKIIKIGGSNAQRDVFNILLVNAATRSGTQFHLELARALVNQRKARKPNSPMTERMAQRLKQAQKNVH